MKKQLFDIDSFRKQPLPTEEEVMANWVGNIEEPVVSVLCHTYNQKSYIEDAFRGFLFQKTNYVFEVIIHDDASTDGTSDIIREYGKRYPKIFKPIIQTENQYSQGKRVILLGTENVRGKFIALCEGDDLWIDKDKLQFQFEALAKNRDVNICISKAFSLFPDSSIENFYESGTELKIISLSESIIGTKKGFLPTATFFLRRTVFENLPSWFEEAPVGDYYIQLLAAKYNGILYMPYTFSIYRRDSIGSWSKGMNDKKLKSDVMRRDKIAITLMCELPRKYMPVLKVKRVLYHKFLLRRSFYENDMAGMLSSIFVILKYLKPAMQFKLFTDTFSRKYYR